MAGEAASSAAPDSGYTAVVYFHGIGQQRRFEETSRLIDSLDRYLAGCFSRGQPRGMLMGIKPQLRPGIADPSDVFTHIVTVFSPDRSGRTELSSVRFHEVYWAPIMAGERSPLGVVRWLGRQLTRPLGTVRSPWRERQRLRRSALAALYEDKAHWPRGILEQDFTTLVQRYDDFESPQALRAFAEGTFAQFNFYLEQRCAGDIEAIGRHLALARAWRRAYLATEARNAALLASLALALALLAGGAVALVLVLLQRFTAVTAGSSLAQLAAAAPPTLTTAASLALTLAGLFGIGGFLTGYVGDIEAWATYEETDEKFEKRAKVIALGAKVFGQVLGDENCRRVVVVAHSLGTTIAHDTLLSLVRTNRVSNPQDPIKGPVPLTKIEHLVTLGSPIDKIEYFFESYRSPFHRYRRVVEELRGDISTAPFTRMRKPFLHWINFWDDGDPVSGALHSPTGKLGFVQRVDNVHVANRPFPSPGASHSGYFFNRDVIATLFDVIYHRAASFRALPPRPRQDPDWSSAFIGPAIDAPGARRLWTLMAIALPWLALSAVIVQLSLSHGAAIAWVPFGITVTIIGVAALTLGRREPRHALETAPIVTTSVGASEAISRDAKSFEPLRSEDADI
ncbi:hypothetical protein KZX46_02535 (plasmid) [Polymorphobacter sp. PAMC 29334]|uniref:hypothetical protein n=1 Tax=Polymorphobacter sp. PAMC 29334 TaxID=2862331 RepID=UPI001C776BF3|nr:hypothetical protein [Polymorphobacter sp. PAMC 29334]QYE33031.1 hypothetical protein KZX46_02535 [Polymorphobacter sp. PAMC 29334]